MNRLTLNLIGIGLTMLLLACCSDRKSKVAVNQIFDESHLSKGERMILKARDEYDFDRILTLSDSLQKTGDISAVTANFYHGGALMHKGMMGEARQYLEQAIADCMPDVADIKGHRVSSPVCLSVSKNAFICCIFVFGLQSVPPLTVGTQLPSPQGVGLGVGSVTISVREHY